MTAQVRILPNRNCVGLTAVLIAMAYAGASQSNGTAFLLAFTLASLAAISFSHAWANVRGITMLIEPVRPVYSGGILRARIGLAADGTQARYGLRLGSAVRVEPLPGGVRRWFDLELPAGPRGRFDRLAVEVRSLYPLGFFTATLRFELPAVHYVYPEPKGDAPPPTSMPGWRSSEISPRFEGEDFAGVRGYRAGESQRHIDWKAVARGQPMLVKLWAGDAGAALVLDYDAVPSADPEARLCQLARWILLADRTGAAYGVRLPGLDLRTGRGEGHRHACLRALAEFAP